jgi:enamine deaminase RidA (YjgF/YER057c/UK114 family)
MQLSELNHSAMPDYPSSLHIKAIEHPGWLESSVTLQGAAGAGFFQQALGQLGGGATVLAVDLFGTGEEISDMEQLVKLAGIAAPVTAVVSSSPGGGGMQFIAATGIEPAPIVLRDSLTGYLINDSGTSHCFLGGLLPGDAGASREDQTREVFRTIEEALALAGMSFEHAARTWFYNEDILDWYPEFNEVRTEFFRHHAIRRMPASTGIGAPNPAGTALTGKAMAVKSGPGETLIAAVCSPLQCDAFAYGSAFSRALEVSDSSSRTLYISGTASIEPGGKSVHQGDPAAQIGLTMDVVRAILNEADMRIEDTTRAIAYFRDPSHIPLWEDYCRNLPPLPIVSLGCHVCRDDLLFEIELDASVRS